MRTLLTGDIGHSVAVPSRARVEPWVRPWITSLSVAAVFLAIYLSVLRPGYHIDDDITMISLASGYLGGQPVPFLVFSNVILGFLLTWLYRLPTSLNWEILIFVVVNFFSVWSLLYLTVSFPVKLLYRVAGVLAVLISDSYFLLSLTFTMIVAFAAVAGFCSVLGAAYLNRPVGRRFYFFGGALLVLGALIRIESVLLVLLSIVMAVLIMHRLFEARSLGVTVTVIAAIVAGCYAFDRFYVQASPDWRTYYAYNDLRSSILDTPRIHQPKFAAVAAQIGWSPVDYKMFTNWFVSNEQTFSAANLQYLHDHVSGRPGNPVGVVISYLYSQLNPGTAGLVPFPYYLLAGAAFLCAAIYRPLRGGLAPLLLTLASFLLLSVYLLWTIKIPARVWYSFLAVQVVFGYFTLLWSKRAAEGSLVRRGWIYMLERFGRYLAGGLILAALTLGLIQAVATSRTNREEQADYQQVLTGLSTLQAQGRLQPNALIVIPAMGIPLEWANPMVLDFPNVQVLELGWLAFSPPYRQVLRQYGEDSLLTGLYSKENIYLMTRASLIDGVLQFIRIHQGVALEADPIFSVNYPGLEDGAYTNTVLYKLKLVQ